MIWLVCLTMLSLKIASTINLNEFRRENNKKLIFVGIGLNICLSILGITPLGQLSEILSMEVDKYYCCLRAFKTFFTFIF